MDRRMRLVLSGGFAVLTAGLCALYAQEVHADADRQRNEVLERFGGQTVRLVVAAEALEAGDVASKQNVVEKDWAGDLVPEGAYLSLDDVIDCKVTVPAAAGAPLTELNFRESDEMPAVPDGYVAIQVPITDKLGLPGSVCAGTRLVAYEVSDDGTKTLSGDVQVLLAQTSPSGLTRGSISVAARPSDVPALLAASAEGSLRLVMPADGVDVAGAAPESVGSKAGTDDAGATGGDAR